MAAINTYWWNIQGHTLDALVRSAACLQYMCIISHVSVSALTMCYTLVATVWTCKKRSMPYRTSSILMIMKIGLTSCMEATILGREWCYIWSLVHSDCLIEALWLVLYRYGLTGLWDTIPETLYVY
jgi:hypothetical protein